MLNCYTNFVISLKTVLPSLTDDDAIDFLERLLIMDSSKRMTADEARTHPFLTKKITTNIKSVDCTTRHREKADSSDMETKSS